jgi:hypothetical protein
MAEMTAPSATAPLYRPRPPLADYIEYFGYWRRDSGDPHHSRARAQGSADRHHRRRPAGALPFAGVPLGELENACISLAALWGHPGAALHERLVAARTTAQRIELVESFLLSRMQTHGHAPTAL